MNAAATGPVASEMLKRLDSALSPSRVELIDDSEKHRGHGGYNPEGESHFALKIESSGLRRQEPGRAATDDLCRARRVDGRASPCAVDPRHRSWRMTMVDDPVLQTISPVTHDLGGFKVHRTLPHKERTMVGPFIFFDQMGPARLAAGTGSTSARTRTSTSRPSPICSPARSTIATASAPPSAIEPGAVNLMTAGRGIAHSRALARDARAAGPELYGIQTWLALAARSEESRSRVRACRRRHVLPIVPAGGVRLSLIDGRAFGGARRSTQLFADHLCRDRACAGRLACRSTTRADERGALSHRGRGRVDGDALEPAASACLRPGIAAPALRERGAR